MVYAVTSGALRNAVPPLLLERVLDGSWQVGDAEAAEFEPTILEAKLKGFRAVFIMSVPVMALCLLGSFFVSDVVLKGDEKEDIEANDTQPPLQVPSTGYVGNETKG